MSRVEYKIINVVSGICLGFSIAIGGIYGFNLETVGTLILSIAAFAIGNLVEKHNRKLD